MMRAVWIGLVGAVLTLGVAQAGECRADGSLLKAVAGPPGMESTDARIDGTTFRVTRVASKFRTASNPANGSKNTPGDMFLLVSGLRGQFLVTSGFAPGSLPANPAISAPASQASSVNWKSRNRFIERKTDLARSIDIMSGPLSGYTLINKSCT